MMKIEIPVMADLLLEAWKLIWRTRVYPGEWKVGLRTPIYKKFDPKVPMNYRPVCMLWCVRKVIESAIAYRL